MDTTESTSAHLEVSMPISTEEDMEASTSSRVLNIPECHHSLTISKTPSIQMLPLNDSMDFEEMNQQISSIQDEVRRESESEGDISCVGGGHASTVEVDERYVGWQVEIEDIIVPTHGYLDSTFTHWSNVY